MAECGVDQYFYTVGEAAGYVCEGFGRQSVYSYICGFACDVSGVFGSVYVSVMLLTTTTGVYIYRLAAKLAYSFEFLHQPHVYIIFAAFSAFTGKFLSFKVFGYLHYYSFSLCELKIAFLSSFITFVRLSSRDSILTSKYAATAIENSPSLDVSIFIASSMFFASNLIFSVISYFLFSHGMDRL